MVLNEGGQHIETQGMSWDLSQVQATREPVIAPENQRQDPDNYSFSLGEMMMHGVVLRGPDLTEARLRATE